jgi:hypothetical protein
MLLTRTQRRTMLAYLRGQLDDFNLACQSHDREMICILRAVISGLCHALMTDEQERAKLANLDTLRLRRKHS